MLCKGPPTQVVTAYTVFMMAMYAMYHGVADREFSAVLTMSAMFQCLAVVLLAMQSWNTKSAAGISAQSLVLEALSFGLRLSGTVWLQGYLPMDKSGDFLYQAIDFCSLVLVLWLLHRVLVVQEGTYQSEEDALPVAPIILVSLVLGILFHADMDDQPLFDALWMASLFIGVFAVVPQLWLITRMNGKVAALTSHYIAAMAASRLLSGWFMWTAREDISCEPWIQGVNHAPWVILGAHALHIFLLGDFAYYYSAAVAKHGLVDRLDLNIPHVVV